MNDDGVTSENCEYTHNFSFGKNCYLVVAAWYVENGLYSYHTNYVKDTVDCLQVFNSEFIYQSFNLNKCSRCFFCAQCEECFSCWFSFDLKNCSDCILSVGLRNKKYCIRNKQYTPEEYAKAIQKLGLESRKGIDRLKKELHELKAKYPHRYANIVKSVNSSGDGLRSCKNANDCFWFNDLEDCRFMVNGDGGKDTYDCNHVGKPSFCYEGLTCDESYRAIATVNCWKCQDVLYSNNCHSSRNLFGCLAIRLGSYAILNKKYSKENYERLKTDIIGRMRAQHEWDEFFPPLMAPFTYNETAAQELRPLDKKEALTKGYRWREQDAKFHEISKTPEELPDRIVDVDDTILKETIGCAHKGECLDQCTTAFRIIPNELSFYRQMNLPLPTLCPNCWHYERLKQQNPFKLWHRACTCAGAKSENNIYQNTAKHFHNQNPCPNAFETSYASDRQEIIYCEKCYQAEVV